MDVFVTAIGKKIYCRLINEHYLQQQDKPLLVFLHEGLGTSEQWKDFPHELSDLFSLPALLYDRYGYGKSETIATPREPNYMETEAMIFLPEILKALHLHNKQLILFGHSDGGSIAAFFASYYPEKVIGAIIEAPHFFLDEISISGIRSALEAYEQGNLKEKLFKYHGQNTESMFRSWTNILLSEQMKLWNTEHLLEQIICPVLAIQGTNDDYGTLRQIETIQEKSKGEVELLIIEDCGHIPHHQARKTVMEASEKFLRFVLKQKNSEYF